MQKKFEYQYYPFSALLLAIGDAVALFLFSFFGTMEHGMDAGFSTLFNITIPFILGWWLAGILAGTYRYHAYSSVMRAFGGVITTALIGVPIGLFLRYVMFDKPVSVEFALVAFVFIIIFAFIWRLAFTWMIRNI